MPGPAKPINVLGSQVETERGRIRAQFDAGATARTTLGALCELADQSIHQTFADMIRVHETSGGGLSLLALGGYGRQMLFPYSDLDILFLFENQKSEEGFRPLISEFSRTMWDLGFRVSSAGRTLEECKRIEEDNAEFHLALLDRRFLAGDQELFERLDKRILPPSERQARPFLFAQLHRLTKERLARYGNTIFHLEPNVKEAPGGLRDYQAAFWLRQILGDRRDLRGSSAADEEMSSRPFRAMRSGFTPTPTASIPRRRSTNPSLTGSKAPRNSRGASARDSRTCAASSAARPPVTASQAIRGLRRRSRP